MKNFNKIKTIALASSLSAVLLVGGTLAYFADGDTVENKFTVGKVSIDLQETNFNEDSDETTNLVPGQEVKKNPAIENNGVNDAYMFMAVTVPTKAIATANADGSKSEVMETQLFGYEADGSWTLLTGEMADGILDGGSALTIKNKTGSYGVRTFDEEKNEGTVTYYYAYTGQDKTTMERVSKDTRTTDLFDAVKFVPAIENAELDEMAPSITVTAYAIQADFLKNNDNVLDGNNNAGTAVPAEVWNILKNQIPATDDKGNEDPSTDVIMA